MMEPDKLTARLAAGRPLVLDGGLATQLEAQGCDLNNALWSASIIGDNPQAIIDAHRAYLEAGADIIITASYQAVDPDLICRAVELALRARDEFAGSDNAVEMPLIAGSIGPYGAVLSDGSEYRGDYGKTVEELRSFHRPRIEQLDASAVDILACETIPSFDEAVALAGLLAGATSPAWISFSCRDEGHLNDGAPIEQVAALFADHPVVKAVGVNCSAPQYVAPLVRKLRQALPAAAILAYPNSGETFNPADKTWTGTTTIADWMAAAREWRSAGANVIGGCCRTGPGHVEVIRQSLQEHPS